MNLDSIRNYFVRNAINNNSIAIIRQRNVFEDSSSLDYKEYMVADLNYANSYMSMTSS